MRSVPAMGAGRFFCAQNVSSEHESGIKRLMGALNASCKRIFKQNKKTPDELGVFRKVFGGAAENRTLRTFASIRRNAEILALDWHKKSALASHGH